MSNSDYIDDTASWYPNVLVFSEIMGYLQISQDEVGFMGSNGESWVVNFSEIKKASISFYRYGQFNSTDAYRFILKTDSGKYVFHVKKSDTRDLLVRKFLQFGVNVNGAAVNRNLSQFSHQQNIIWWVIFIAPLIFLIYIMISFLAR